jgi:hypothetical protein
MPLLDSDPPEDLVRARAAQRRAEAQRGLHLNDPRRDDRELVAMEERIEDRATELMRSGLCEDAAWKVAQDEIAPVEGNG